MAPHFILAMIIAAALLFFLKCIQAFGRDMRPGGTGRGPDSLVSLETYPEPKAKSAAR